MKRAIFFVLFALTFFLSASVTHAQTTTAWTGFFFNNVNLQGGPVLVREDAAIDFVWGSGSPSGEVNADNFSARWIRWVFMDTPGNWTFTTITDDGVRLFVDDTLIIDGWVNQPPTARTAIVNLAQGYHLVRMEYFERTGNAEAHLQIISASFPDWRGEYFNNLDLAGAPVFVRNDSAINFNFGTAGPGGGIPGTNFSARWTRSQYFAAGTYRFTATTDDGARVWVDNQLIINQWRDQPPTSASGDLTLAAGNHFVKMEYFQRAGGALAQLAWTPVAGGGEVWNGEYFNNPGLTGAPVAFRVDDNLNFNWNSAPPTAGIASGQNWSARWNARRAASVTGYYTVVATADDGVRVFVDNNNILDKWFDQAPTTYAVTVYLGAGQHDWRVEYYQRAGGASLSVSIAYGVTNPPPPAPPTPIVTGDLILDDNATGFLKGGLATGWHDVAGGYGGHAFSTENNPFTQPYYNWARWYPRLPRAGFYLVEVYLPGGVGTTRNARYWIAHAGTFNFRALNQAAYANQWVALGTYYFVANGTEYVSLADVTYEPFLSTMLAVDAVKFSPR
ncbi:MAG: hypothetical protein HY070_04165 [Chloroflexi bacterium]|nr:hypothetical protein [Chloroflexota bacterium]